MVHDVDVVMQMSACAVGVRNHEVVSAVHAASEFHAELVHTLDVLGIVHVELLGREVLRVCVHLIASMKRG